MIDLACWWCGVEADDVVEVHQHGRPVRLIPHWPPGDHQHSETPPTPAHLEQAGHEALMRIVGATDLRPESQRLGLPTEKIR